VDVPFERGRRVEGLLAEFADVPLRVSLSHTPG
jgi:hypothetical protein